MNQYQVLTNSLVPLFGVWCSSWGFRWMCLVLSGHSRSSLSSSMQVYTIHRIYSLNTEIRTHCINLKLHHIDPSPKVLNLLQIFHKAIFMPNTFGWQIILVFLSFNLYIFWKYSYTLILVYSTTNSGKVSVLWEVWPPFIFQTFVSLLYNCW